MVSSLKNEKLKKRAAQASVGLAIFLCLIKAGGAFYTDSLAVLSSLADSLSDIFASFISYTAIKFSTRPATCEHRYGFGHAESISALVQSAFIAGSGCFVMYDAAARLYRPAEVVHSSLGILIMVLSLLLSFLLVMFQRRVAKITKSRAIIADSAHYTVDILTNAAVIISLILTSFFKIFWIDIATGAFIALYLIYTAYQLGFDAVSDLTDRELPKPIRAQVLSLIINTEGVINCHDLRSRDLGGAYAFEVHLEIDGKTSLLQAHRISEKVEQKIRKKFAHAQVIVHQDPYGVREERLDDSFRECV